MSSTNPTKELKTKIEVEKSMKLIDINGKNINFRSECIVTPTSSEPFYIAIVNQNDLDNGSIKFELCQGVFSRRVTYESEDNEHLNHYIAFKKMPATNEQTVIKPDVIVRLTELKQSIRPPVFLPNEPIMSSLQVPTQSQSQSQMQMQMQTQTQSPPEEVELLKAKLHELSLSSDYKESNTLYRNIAIGCFFLVILFVILKK